MNSVTKNENVTKQNATLIFNIAVMTASFIVALIALPQELFFVVAAIILFALREVEKEISRSSSNRFHMFLNGK